MNEEHIQVLVRTIKLILILTAGFLPAVSLEIGSAYAQIPIGTLPRNISIEVEFKETDVTTRKVGPLRPYQRRRSSQYTKQHIVVSDGLTASIRVGKDVPYVEYYTRYLVDHGYVEVAEAQFREVGTKLVVTPKIRGGYIEVSLTPQISYLEKGKRNTVNIRELTTTVLASDGQPITVGGLIKDKDFAEYFLQTQTRSNLDIILTPRLQ